MRRLVVAHALPYHGVAVLLVVPEGVDAVGGGNGCSVDAQSAVALCAHDEFLTPVAEDVGDGSGVVLGTVAGVAASGGEESSSAGLVDGTFASGAARAVHDLVEEVSVPVDALVEVAPVEGIVGASGGGSALDDLVGGQGDESGLRGASHGTGEFVGEVAGEGSSVVARGLQAVEDLARGGVIVGAGGFVLVAGELLLSVAIGVEVGAVLCVAVSESCGAETLAVVVDNHASEDNLIASVPVHVGNLEVVESIAEVGVVPSAVVVPAPALREFVGDGVDVECTHLMTRVAPAPEKDAGVASVEERCSEVVLGGAVAGVVLSPGLLVLGASGSQEVGGLALLHAWQGVGHGREGVLAGVPSVGFAGLSIEIEEVLGSVAGVLVAGRIVVHIANLYVVSGGGVDDHVIGTAHDALRLSVLVPVECHEVPLLIGSCHEVGSEVYAPESLAAEVVALVEVEARLVAGLVERGAAAGVVALDDEFHDAVAGDVAEGDVVELVHTGDGGSGTVYDGADHDVEVSPVPARNLGAFLLFHAADDGSHLILAGGVAGGVREAGGGESCLQEFAVAVEVVGHVVVFLAKYLPADEVAAAAASVDVGGHGYETTVEAVGPALGEDGGRQCHQRKQ